MGDEYQRGVLVPIEPKNQVNDGLAGLFVEIAGRFVGKKNGRLRDKGPRQGNPLLFAPRELAGGMVDALTQLHLIEHGHGAASGVPGTFEFQWQHDVFQCIEVWDQLERLENKADVLSANAGTAILVKISQAFASHPDSAFRGQIQSGEKTQQR